MMATTPAPSGVIYAICGSRKERVFFGCMGRLPRDIGNEWLNYDLDGGSGIGTNPNIHQVLPRVDPATDSAVYFLEP